jgi:hypothetical protein
MRIGATGAHFSRHPDRLHQFFRRRACAQCRQGMTIDAVGALCHVGHRNRDNLLGFCRERAVSKDSFTERVKGGLLIWR